MTAPRTLYDKLWDDHVVRTEPDGTSLVYIERHLIHEVTSAQPFDALRGAGRPLWRSDPHLAIAEHNVPTTGRALGIADPLSRLQVETLANNTREFGIRFFPMDDPRQGIVHVAGPEQGFTQPGITLVCGDSHTSTHGAFAALAFGIGTSEIEMVLATQCLWSRRARTARVTMEGALQPGVSAKDLALYLIGLIGIGGATGHALEFAGPVVRALSMEGRMTLCNMAIEAGARVGLVAVDETTIDYLRERPMGPPGEQFQQAARWWRTLVSDDGARFDSEITIDATAVSPQVTWGTLPDLVLGIDGRVPAPEQFDSRDRQEVARAALQYMGLAPGMRVTDIELDKVFIGSCTNSRIEDLRAAAAVIGGRKVSPRLKAALVVPGSGEVKRQAEAEGLAARFIEAGFEWREPGCSMCLGMNEDRLEAGERCASTSNRNFEGRQGAGGRTHLVSPAMAAAAAIAGHFVDVRGELH
ncbi:MAG TPA: 3-isopropylmalate dehydratase large subunit [Burkholderiaceae bacterium]|nr:3-isopropylmalate dehydratase large subunit [Burkholderiaceae bacterium]